MPSVSTGVGRLASRLGLVGHLCTLPFRYCGTGRCR